MPKKVEYAGASLSAAIDLAKTVVDMGGGCTPEMAAARMGRKLEKVKGGAFATLCSSAVKFGLVRRGNNKVTVTDLGKKIALAYNDKEKQSLCVEAFLSVSMFANIVNRFRDNGKIPISDLSIVLAREYDVTPSKTAENVAKRFEHDAIQFGIIDEDGNILQHMPVDAVKTPSDDAPPPGAEGQEETVTPRQGGAAIPAKTPSDDAPPLGAEGQEKPVTSRQDGVAIPAKTPSDDAPPLGAEGQEKPVTPRQDGVAIPAKTPSDDAPPLGAEGQEKPVTSRQDGAAIPAKTKQSDANPGDFCFHIWQERGGLGYKGVISEDEADELTEVILKIRKRRRQAAKNAASVEKEDSTC